MRFILSVLFLLVSALISYTQDVSGKSDFFDSITAPAAIVADVSTGTVLYSKGAELKISPASLTKLMTLHLSLSDCEAGFLDKYGVYEIPECALASDMRPDSSVFGFQKGDRAVLLTIQRAAAVLSAGDAAWALAALSESRTEGMSSASCQQKVKFFINRMNKEAIRLGMNNTVYTDPDGWSEHNISTVSDQLKVSVEYIKRHPEALSLINSLPQMEYLPDDSLSKYPARRNTNLLIGSFPGVDGLKTGTIPSAGFHFAATASDDRSRFIAIVMGIKTNTYFKGLYERAAEAEKLLKWAFENYRTFYPQTDYAGTIKVLNGKEKFSKLEIIPAPVPLTIKKSSEPVVMVVEKREYLTAPVFKGTAAGSITWYSDGRVIWKSQLLTKKNIQKKWNFIDSVKLLLWSKK